MNEMDKMLDKSLGVITEGESKLALFKGKEIRKIFHDNEWHYSIVDVIAAIIESDRARKYWNDLKKNIEKEGFFQLSEKIGHLKMRSQSPRSPPSISISITFPREAPPALFKLNATPANPTH